MKERTLNIKYLCFLFILNVFNTFSQKPKGQDKKEIEKVLIGKWNNLQDSNYVLIIKKHIIIDVNENEIMDKSRYIISSKKCSVFGSSFAKGKYFLIKIDKENSKMCYLITINSKSSFSLTYEGGKVYDFKKLDN